MERHIPTELRHKSRHSSSLFRVAGQIMAADEFEWTSQ